MKAKIAVLFLVGLLCLTTGCSNTSPITKEPASVSSSESKPASEPPKTAQAEQKTKVEKSQGPAQKEAKPAAEATANGAEWNTQTETVPADRESDTTLPAQPGEPARKTDSPERQPETTAPTAPTETEPPAPPAMEAPKPAEQPQPTGPPTQETTEQSIDIGYWISFAKNYAESVGLALNSEAVYCWDNPIDADSGCIYLERDIQSRLNRYAADGDITDVWIWYESISANSYRIYIGYA